MQDEQHGRLHRVPSKVSPPLVIKNNDSYTIAPNFVKILPDLLELQHLTYQIGKSHDPKVRRKLNEEWRDPKILKGKTGGLFTDYPGLVTYNTDFNIVAVVFRGSCKFGDWVTNVDGRRMDAKKEDFKFEGNFRCGILKKYQDCKENLIKEISYFVEELDEERQSSLQFVITGHSQGGALAEIASIDLAEEYLKNKYLEFNNTIQNKIYGWYISSASVAPFFFLNDSSSECCNKIIGKDNVIWQTVKYDMLIGFGYDKIPLLGRLLQVKHPGHLALTHFQDAIKNHLRIFKGDFEDRAKSGRLWNIWSSVYNSSYVIYSVVKNNIGVNIILPIPFRLVLMGLDCAFKKSVGEYTTDIVCNTMALSHNGSSKHDPRGAFDPKIIETNLSQLLKQGSDYYVPQKGRFFIDGTGTYAPIYHAAMQGHLDLVKILDSNEQNINPKGHGVNRKLALEIAKKKRKENIGDLELTQKYDKIINYLDYMKGTPSMITPLHIAAVTNDMELLNASLAGKTESELLKPPTIFSHDSKGKTAYHWAAYYGNKEVLNALLDKNYYGRFFIDGTSTYAPIYYAAMQGHLDLVKILDSNEQNVNPEGHGVNRKLALEIAKKKRKENIDDLELTQKYDKTVNYLDYMEETPSIITPELIGKVAILSLNLLDSLARFSTFKR